MSILLLLLYFFYRQISVNFKNTSKEVFLCFHFAVSLSFLNFIHCQAVLCPFLSYQFLWWIILFVAMEERHAFAWWFLLSCRQLEPWLSFSASIDKQGENITGVQYLPSISYLFIYFLFCFVSGLQCFRYILKTVVFGRTAFRSVCWQCV